MKINQFAKLGLSLAVIVLIALGSYNLTAQSNLSTTKEVINDINITIDKLASDSDFKDIKKTLKDYGIEATFSNIKRNDLNEITGISIALSSENGQQAMSQMSSNVPISEVSFGSKNGSLYVGQGSQQRNGIAFWNGNRNFPPHFNTDSIFSQHFQSFKQFSLDDFFNDKNSVFMFNGDSLTIDELKDKMMQNFSFKNPSSDRLSFLFNDDYDSSAGKFSFIDDPNKEKVIVIDGIISDFKTLDTLAKEDKIKHVDVLKPETAMSIYGNKAKDGAIIVTTK